MCRDGGKTTRRWCKVSRTASRTVTGGLQDLGKLRIVGVALIPLVGLIHLLVTPEYYGFVAYLGLLIFANFAGSIVSAVGIHQGRIWGLVARGRDGWRRFLGLHREQDVGAARASLLGAVYGARSRLRSHRAFSPSFWRRSSWGWPRTCLAGRGRLPLPPARLCNASHSTMSPGSLGCFDSPARR
jgi:hypothetical protein